jgi:hypothetical protein
MNEHAAGLMTIAAPALTASAITSTGSFEELRVLL